MMPHLLFSSTFTIHLRTVKLFYASRWNIKYSIQQELFICAPRNCFIYRYETPIIQVDINQSFAHVEMILCIAMQH